MSEIQILMDISMTMMTVQRLQAHQQKITQDVLMEMAMVGPILEIISPTSPPSGLTKTKMDLVTTGMASIQIVVSLNGETHLKIV